jgi:ActR/RegA family two-component response regulator
MFGGGAKVVLVIDPSDAFRAGFAGALRAGGAHVVDTGCVQDGLALARRHRPDVITCELYFDDKAQWPLIEGLRAACPLVPLTVVTAFAVAAAAVTRAIRLGASGVLCKPVSPASILANRSGDEDIMLGAPLRLSLHRAVWEFINQTVIEAGSISQAARQLGLQSRSLRRMLQKSPPAW